MKQRVIREWINSLSPAERKDWLERLVSELVLGVAVGGTRAELRAVLARRVRNEEAVG